MKLYITPTLKTKLDILSSEYQIEIGGYLTGKIRDGDIYLDDLLIPTGQNVSSAHVEINTSDQVNMLKKYGPAKCQTIIGHWHSHHNMGCFWSGQDISNMINIMSYKQLYVFVVSSNKNHLVKVCLRNPISLDLNNVDFVINSLVIDIMRRQVENIFGENRFTKKDEDEDEDEDEPKNELDSKDEDQDDNTYQDETSPGGYE